MADAEREKYSYRVAQVLTSQAIMLALDPQQSIGAAAAEFARRAKGDAEAIDAVKVRVREIANQHPGLASERAAAIVDVAAGRIASLQQHPSAAASRRARLRLIA